MFSNGGLSSHAAQYAKSRALIKVMKAIFNIDPFEEQYVIIKGLFQSKQLEKHMGDIGVDQSLINSALYEHRCLENINSLLKTAVKCEDQQRYNAMI